MGGRLGSILINLGYVDDDDITSVLSRQYGVPSINLAYFEIDPSVIKLIPMETAQKYMVVPLSRVGSTADDRHAPIPPTSSPWTTSSS